MNNKNKLIQIELILETLTKDSYTESLEKKPWLFEHGKRLYELETRIKRMEGEWSRGEMNPDDFNELWIPASEVLKVLRRMQEIVKNQQSKEGENKK